jgi:REP element-mobilizing transposase RayT
MEPVGEFQTSRRNLPHWQQAGAVYFVTWRTVKDRVLSEAERSVVLDAILHWHRSRWFVYAAIVMPDHVHLLARTLPVNMNAIHERVFDLGEVVGSVKKFSARKINEADRARGAVWQDERYDRIQRDGREFEESWRYIRDNPVVAELVTRPEDYRWMFESGTAE